MFFKKKEEPKIEPVVQSIDSTKLEILELRLQSLQKKVIDQDLVIHRLLELVIMNIEHKDYSRFLLPQITKIRNILDKK